MNTNEHRDDDSPRLGTVSPAPTKFIQICASQNDQGREHLSVQLQCEGVDKARREPLIRGARL